MTKSSTSTKSPERAVHHNRLVESFYELESLVSKLEGLKNRINGTVSEEDSTNVTDSNLSSLTDVLNNLPNGISSSVSEANDIITSIEDSIF